MIKKCEAITMIKQDALDCILALPDTADWEDILYSLYVIQKIEKSLREAEKEKGVTIEEARKELGIQ